MKFKRILASNYQGFTWQLFLDTLFTTRVRYVLATDVPTTQESLFRKQAVKRKRQEN